MKLNLKTELKDLEGKPLTYEDSVFTAGKALSLILSQNKSVDSIRSYSLAVDCYQKEEMELNASDEEFIKEALKNCQTFTPIVTGQLLTLLSAKEK